MLSRHHCTRGGYSIKKLKYYIIPIMMCTIVLSGCSAKKNEVNNSSFESIEKSIGEKSLEFKENLLLDNKPILNMSYKDVIKNFGEPDKIRTEKILFSASSADNYTYLGILCYEGLEIEFDLGEKEHMKSIQQADVWRFDITNDKYNIGQLRVGMSIEEFHIKFANSKLYSMSDILKNNTDNFSYKDIYNISALRRLLVISKPRDYYGIYKNVFYEEGVLIDKGGNVAAPLGFALLIKDNKIDRIVYGYPNAE